MENKKIELKKIVSETNENFESKKHELRLEEIPPKELFNSDLRKLKGYNEVRMNVKDKKAYNDFVDSFCGVIDLLPYSKYDSEIVKFVCQSAEDYFIKRKGMGSLKEEAVIAVCKRYFNDDDELVHNVIGLVLPTIIKSTFYRRNKKRVHNFFCAFLNLFCIKSN